MLVKLSEEQGAELQKLLESSLGDLSTEIASTDNPDTGWAWRRRSVLESVLYQLDNPPRASN